MSQQTGHLYEFGPFSIDTVNRLLLRDGKPVPLKPKVVDTLLMLVESMGRVVQKDELIAKLWPDRFVEEANLTQNIYVLRKVLGSGEYSESYIETIPRRGYRFAAPVDVKPYEETSSQQSEAQDFEKAVPAVSLAAPRARIFRQRVVIASLLAIGVLALIGYYVLSNRRAHLASNGQIKSLAILPFRPLSPESSDDYMGQGMADALITKLSNSRQIAVRSTSAVLHYSARGEDPIVAGRQLGVDAVLEGKIQQSGDRLRVTVQLLRVADGASLWAEKFDEKLTDIFAVQDSISDQAARSLTLQLTGTERELMRKHYTENAEAYQAYLQGRYFWNKRNADGFKKAVDFFQRAIEIDPDYAPAYGGLADCYMRLNESGVPMAQESVPRARAAVLKALEIDDALAEAHATLAFIKFRHDWDFAAAEQEFKRSIQLDANYSEAHQWHAFYLLAVGRPGEAEAEMKRAQELDPLSVNLSGNAALFLFFKHDFDRSVQQCLKTLEMEPSYNLARVTLGLNYEQKGLNEAAIAEFKKAREVAPNDAGSIAALAHALAKSGRADEARALLRALEERSKESYVLPYNIAIIYAGLGEKTKALEWLNRALQDRSLRPVWLKTDPRLNDLRQTGELDNIFRQVGLTP